jgi:HAD superfamily hydrolase (TIGR01490 family)
MKRLVLFDLDHTLLPIDSDYEWGCFLGRIGIVDAADFQSRNHNYAEQYKAGTLDVLEFLGFSLGLIANRPREEIEAWRRQYMEEVIEPNITPQARSLVDSYVQRGDLCALVTATNTFVTAPIARAFGIEHLVGSEAEQVDGVYTGRPRGTPSFREGKVTRTEEWLASLHKTWRDFDEVWFYSDSSNDIPLLEHATHPVATNPDPGLLALARMRHWPVIELFA